MAEPLPRYHAKTMWTFMGLGFALGIVAVLIASAIASRTGQPGESLVLVAIVVRMISIMRPMAVILRSRSPERQPAWAIGDRECACWSAVIFVSLLVSDIADLDPAVRHARFLPLWLNGGLQAMVPIQLFGMTSKRDINERKDVADRTRAARAARVPKSPLGLGPIDR